MTRERCWTRREVEELQDWKFPGGYSACETRGDCTFDVDAALMAVNFGPQFLVHVKGAKGGTPIYPEDWQAAAYATMFGYKRPDGLRRYRMVYMEIARGNGKSTMCAVIVGVLLYIDDEPGADIFSAAGTRDQAREVFSPFKMNVMGNEDLAAISQAYQNSITRLDPRTGLPVGCYKAISSDANFQHGGSPSGIIFDELHVQPNRDLWDVLHTGKIKRRQSLTVAITTAGYDRNSICYEQRRMAEQVRDGIYSDAEFLPIIYAAENDDDWTSPETWKKANPNVGVSVREEDLAKECERAKQIPAYENTFKRLHLDMWTEQESRWLPMARWKLCSGPLPNLDGRACWAGLDLSTTTDITAFVLAFKNELGGCDIVSHFWIPAENAKDREDRDRVPYREWSRRGGNLTLTPGNVVDYDIVRRDINALGKRYNIQEIAIDRWNATQITSQLMGDGFNVVEHGQGFRDFSGPSKEFETVVFGGTLRHGDNPVLNWMAGNVAAEIDAAGNIKPSKKKSSERIDGIVAAVMAVGRAMAGVEKESVYKRRAREGKNLVMTV